MLPTKAERLLVAQVERLPNIAAERYFLSPLPVLSFEVGMSCVVGIVAIVKTFTLSYH